MGKDVAAKEALLAVLNEYGVVYRDGEEVTIQGHYDLDLLVRTVLTS